MGPERERSKNEARPPRDWSVAAHPSTGARRDGRSASSPQSRRVEASALAK